MSEKNRFSFMFEENKKKVILKLVSCSIMSSKIQIKGSQSNLKHKKVK